MCCVLCFFFFKQKTAYEMRISDWSSDVCSSDLIMEVERRIAAILPRYPYLVAEEDGRVVGYAYASEHRTRAAYRTSIDVTVYVALGAQRSGVARRLYSHLLPAAASLG